MAVSTNILVRMLMNLMENVMKQLSYLTQTSHQLYIIGDMNIDSFLNVCQYHKFKKERRSYLLTNQI